MTVEDRLRRALQEETERVEVDPRAWEKVQARVGRRRVTRAIGGSVLVAAALVAAVVGMSALLADGDAQRVTVTPPAGEGSSPAATPTTPTTPTAPTTTTTPTTTTSLVAPGAVGEGTAFPGIWPFPSEEAVEDYVADPGVGMFFDAEATALEFARTYLGMPDPAATDGGVVVDGSTAAVEVTPRPGAPMKTTIEVRRFGGATGPWSVVGARAPNIEVDQPAPLAEVGSTIALSGTSTAYEANVIVEVRADGQSPGEYLGQTFVMGGANGEMAPFAGEITIDAPATGSGAVIFTSESAEDGALQEATVVRIVFAP